MEDQKEANTKRQFKTRLESIKTLSNVLFLVLEDVRIVYARTCWIV